MIIKIMIAVCSKTRAARFGADILTVPIRSYSDRDDTSVRGECAGQQTSTASRSSRMQPIQQEFASLTLTSTISMSSRAKISAAPPRQSRSASKTVFFRTPKYFFPVSVFCTVSRFPYTPTAAMQLSASASARLTSQIVLAFPLIHHFCAIRSAKNRSRRTRDT